MVKPDNTNYETATTLKNEYVIEVIGTVVERESKNKNIITGEIEVIADQITILNSAQTPPIIIDDNDNANEEIRLKYRYLDLRKPKQLSYLIERSKITQSFRNTLLKNDFTEIETPILGKSTPEGARDYLVPSRLYSGQFYALPQSPQIYKQLLMVAGLEKYYQVAKCFRDEDLRADRQPEFTQIDIEASFVKQEDIMGLAEEIMKDLFTCLGKKITLPIPVITHQDAINYYGSDKPDTRFDLKLETFNFKNIPIYENAKIIKGIKVGLDQVLTRKQIDKYSLYLKDNFNVVLSFIKKENDQVSGSVAKFIDNCPLANNEIIFLVGGNVDVVCQSLGALRIMLANDLKLIDHTQDNLLWVVDWPLLGYDEEAKRYFAQHHPFTAPRCVKMLKEKPLAVLANAYDLVWNGYEVAGGSIRIHDQQVQDLMFKTLGFSAEEIKAKFGFFVESLQYGTPPHGGIAFGLDRIVMLATKTNNIKDVIAFPKTQSARDLMMEAPSKVESEQLSELGIKIL